MPEDIFLIETARPGATGGNVSTVDWTTIRTDVDGLLERPDIQQLGDVPDVDTNGAADGHALVYDADDPATPWKPAAINTGFRVRNETDSIGLDDPRAIIVNPGLTVELNGSYPQFVYITPTWGGSGSASSIARSDHTHTIPTIERETFGDGAYMSSGTRPLDSRSVTLLSGIRYLVRATLNLQMRGADPGACYYRLRVTIDGNARESVGGSAGFWCVQGVPDKTTWSHHREIVGTGAAVTISADVIYHSGGGFYPDAGEIEIELLPNR